MNKAFSTPGLGPPVLWYVRQPNCVWSQQGLTFFLCPSVLNPPLVVIVRRVCRFRWRKDWDGRDNFSETIKFRCPSYLAGCITGAVIILFTWSYCSPDSKTGTSQAIHCSTGQFLNFSDSSGLLWGRSFVHNFCPWLNANLIACWWQNVPDRVWLWFFFFFF